MSATSDDVVTVPADLNTYTVTGSNPAKTYRIQVSSRNDAGKGASSTVFYLRPATPPAVTGMKVTYTELEGAILSWKAAAVAPSEYLLTVVRVADHKTLVDEKSIPGGEKEIKIPELDARGMFTIALQTVNKAGKGPVARLVIGNENPNPVKSVAAIRDPGNAGTVLLSWLPSDNTMKGNVLGYEVGYGHAKADERVFVKNTDAQVAIPADKSVVIIVRVVTDTGKSRWSNPVRVPLANLPTQNTTNQRIDLAVQDGILTVGASESLANDSRLVVSIAPTTANGGFTDTQYSQVGAQALSFRTVPDGSYLVTVGDGSKELARKYVNIGRTGLMGAGDWRVYLGKAGINGDTVDMFNTGENRVFSTRVFPTQDMVLASRAQLRAGDGYGVWFRTSGMETNAVTGLSFQYDPKWGNKFIIRQWNQGKECSTPIATTPFPSGMSINGAHDIVVAAKGDSVYATIDGVRLFDLPSLSSAIAGNACRYPAPTGTGVGLRTWGGKTSAIFTGTTVS